MSLPQSIKSTNLLLSALLECAGAEVKGISAGARYSEVSIDLEGFSQEKLTRKIDRLKRVVERVENDEEWRQIFNGTLLGELENKYICLKRRVVSERNKQHDTRRIR